MWPVMDDQALAIDLPVIIKARQEGTRRLVAVEASCEVVDSEGDIVLQKALLDGSKRFLESGFLDLEHVGEIGARYGIPNPSSWIVGRPTGVQDIGGGRTEVQGELQGPRADGQITKADELWASLTAEPPVIWRASIYGFPTAGGLIDARVEKCAEYPTATRYIMKGLSWRSLAFTRNPVCDAIQGHARIITAKSFALGLMRIGTIQKGDVGPTPMTLPSEMLLPPRNRVEMLGHYTHHILPGKCCGASTGSQWGRSVAGFRDHFQQCCGLGHDDADLMGNAMMNLLKHNAPRA